MRKLELKDICGYLPHELKMYAGILHGAELTYPVLGFFIEKTIKTYVNGDNCDDGYILMDMKQYCLRPILRPLSDLYKEITNNGSEPFIPILELAKTMCPATNWEFRNIPVCQDRHFDYNKRAKSFEYITPRGSLPIYNYYKLLGKLHEWKIDCLGLTDARLAVSVYDLSENPYK